VLAVLCVTEVIGYGVLFYAFPVLAVDMAADTGWSTAELTAAFSLALVVSAWWACRSGGCWTGPARGW
jgi:hypothetical protein